MITETRDSQAPGSINNKPGEIIFLQNNESPDTVEPLTLIKENRFNELITYFDKLALESQLPTSQDVLFELLKEIIWKLNDDLSNNLKMDLKQVYDRLLRLGLSQIRYSPENFLLYSKNFTNKNIENNYTKTAKHLELLRNLYEMAEILIGVDQVSETIRQATYEFWKRATNYILKIRAQVILQFMREGSGFTSYDIDQQRVRTCMINEDFEQYRINPLNPAIKDLVKGRIVSPMAPGILGIYGGGSWEPIGFIDQEEVDNKEPILHPLGELKMKLGQTLPDATDTADFHFMLSLPVRRQIEYDFNIDLSQLDIRIQQYFLTFLKKAPADKREEIRRYTKTYGKPFFTAFLSLSHNDDYQGQRILDLCNNLDTTTTQIILEKYQDLFSASEKVQDYLRTNYSEQMHVPETEEAIAEQLLRKGREALVYAASNQNNLDIASYMESYKAEIQLFANTFKALKLSGLPVELEQFKAIHIERIPGDQLTEPIKQQLLAMSDANWQDQGRLGAIISSDFRSLLNDEQRLTDTDFYLVQHNQDVLGCFRLDQKPDGSYYFGSVLARKDIAGAKIGETLLDQLFTAAASNRLVKAHCNPQSAITSKYIGKYDFIATGLIDYAEPGDTFEIIRDDRPKNPQNAPKQAFKGKSYEELVGLVNTFLHGSEAILRHYRFPQEYDRFVQEGRKLLNQLGYKITTYKRERNPKNNLNYHVAIGFERFTDIKPADQVQ